MRLSSLIAGLALAGSLGIGSIAMAGTASAVQLPVCSQANHLTPPNCVPAGNGGQYGGGSGNGNNGNGNNGNKGGQGNGGQYGDPGNQCQQDNTWKGLKGDLPKFPQGCCPQDNHSYGPQVKTDIFPDGNCDPAPPCNQGGDQKNFNQQDNWNNCLPQPKPPVNCHDQWGWQDSWVNVNGHETDHKTWGEGTCFTNYPEPKPAPKPCKCDVQTITFDFAPTNLVGNGTWLLEKSGPALHDGETLTYHGQTWTVEQWNANGNGSLGNHLPYFVLRDGTELSGSVRDGLQTAHTICSSIHPLFA